MRSVILIVPIAAGTASAEKARTLRVCADPNAYPFSDERGAGFENRIAEVIADELGAEVEYTWWAQHRGFFRNTLKAERCDVVIGVPTGLEMVRATRPYYRSSYVFVTREDRELDITSLSDPRLATLRIAVQLVGDDGANAPPAHALALRGIVDNVVGYPVTGDYRREKPGAVIVEAVAAGDVDVAIVWGPLAGPIARDSEVPLTVTPVDEAEDGGYPMQFDIGVGVRKKDKALARELDRALKKRRKAIDKILDEFRVPRVK